jgi:hypothetical protein
LRASPLDLLRLVRADGVSDVKRTHASLSGDLEVAERYSQFRQDTHRYRYVYVLLTSPLTEELEKCVEERLEPAPGLRVTRAGEFFHYWADRRVGLQVVGPYHVRAARAD